MDLIPNGTRLRACEEETRDLLRVSSREVQRDARPEGEHGEVRAIRNLIGEIIRGRFQ